MSIISTKPFKPFITSFATLNGTFLIVEGWNIPIGFVPHLILLSFWNYWTSKLRAFYVENIPQVTWKKYSKANYNQSVSAPVLKIYTQILLMMRCTMKKEKLNSENSGKNYSNFKVKWNTRQVIVQAFRTSFLLKGYGILMRVTGLFLKSL